MRFNYDFSKGIIKHKIEEEFYALSGKVLPKNTSSTIVTGPDYQRHIDNYKKYINGKLRICEINLDIFIDIYKGLKKYPLIDVLNKSVEHYGSTFIDCDLTCVSDIDVIKKTLLKQIEIQCTSSNSKVFIFSFSLRTSKVKDISQYIRPIFGLLGSYVVSISKNDNNLINLQRINKNDYCHNVILSKTIGRIKNYKAYSYNAGGGPMFTCYIEYK